MQIATIVGNIGKDAVVRNTQQGDKLASFSVAVSTGFGDRKATTWWDVTMWGQRGEKLAPYLTKGSKVTCVGEISQREHEGKTYLQLRADHVGMQGDGQRQDAGEQRSTTNGGTSRQHQPAGYDSDLDDSVPFATPFGEW